MGMKDAIKSIMGSKLLPQDVNGSEGGMMPVPMQEMRLIGENDVKKAAEILVKYQNGKKNMELRITENEEWYRLRHWDKIRGAKADVNDPEPVSAWLFNSIANKHADAMDNYPEPNVLPREESDKSDAKTLSSILPVILENNEFEQTYSDTWWYKLKHGTGVYGIFWNNKLEDGLGDIDIKQIDLLNIFWEPGIKDIQKSKNVFTVELVSNDSLLQQYPDLLKGKVGNTALTLTQYKYDDNIDTTNTSAVIDWYYKQSITENGVSREILQYCKFVNGVVLYASENVPEYQRRGYYDHAKYPFVFDTLFPEEGTPCGFGYVDIMKDPQKYIDKLNQLIMMNANLLANPRYFVQDQAGINKEQFADKSNPFVDFTGRLSDDNFRQVEVEPIGNFVIQHLQNKIDELKETSGNRDFSQGGTGSGVTAASAIAALQEAGSKLSRDPIKSSYRSFSSINYFCLELIRQFYDEKRTFRIDGEKGQEFVKYDNKMIKPQHQGSSAGRDLGFRRPVFDIKITSQKSSPFSKVAQNEFAKELWGMGMFNPQIADQALIALDMMDFEAKDIIIGKIKNNATMLNSIIMMQQQMAQMAATIDQMQGTNLSMAIEGQNAELSMQIPEIEMAAAAATEQVDTNALGKEVQGSNKAQERAMSIAQPKS